SGRSLHVDATKFKNSMHAALGCTDCHVGVKEYPHPKGMRLPNCTTCHEDAVHGYQLGVHAVARKDGDGQAPTCTACHGGPLQILAASDPDSPVSHIHIPNTCAKCHAQKFVMERAGFSTQPYYSYEESVHGKAVAAGSTKAAVCTDCHG